MNCHPLAQAQAVMAQTFSSPSNGSDDLYGSFDGNRLEVRSAFQENKLVWTLDREEFESIHFLRDGQYEEPSPDDEDTPIAVVIVMKQSNTYIVIACSDIWEISGLEITRWRAEVGNSNVTYVSGHIEGIEDIDDNDDDDDDRKDYTIIPADISDSTEKTWKPIIELMNHDGDVFQSEAKLRWILHDAPPEMQSEELDQTDLHY